MFCVSMTRQGRTHPEHDPFHIHKNSWWVRNCQHPSLTLMLQGPSVDAHPFKNTLAKNSFTY